MTITVAQLKTLEAFTADEARETLARPFSCEIGGKHYVVATDGYRAAVYRNGDGSESYGLTVPGSPPISQVTPKASELVLLGRVSADFIDAARQLPRKWSAILSLESKSAKLTATVTTGSKRKQKTAKLFSDTPVTWPVDFDMHNCARRGINAHYLVDAFNFIDSKICCMYGAASDALSPYVFTSGPEWPHADRFMVVMPCRV